MMKVKRGHGFCERWRAGWRRSGRLSGSAGGRSVRSRRGEARDPGEPPSSGSDKATRGSLELGLSATHLCLGTTWPMLTPGADQLCISRPGLSETPEVRALSPSVFLQFSHLSATPLIPPPHPQPMREPQQPPTPNAELLD